MVKVVLTGVVMGGLLVGQPEAAGAQTFILEPGEITTRFLDQPPLEKASTQFLARFQTAIPLVSDRVAVAVIVEWTPLRGDGGRLGEGKANTPAFLWGLVGKVFGTRRASFELGALFDYAQDPTGNSNFAHQLVADGGLKVHVGRWLGLPGNLRRLSSYTSFRYQLTGRPAGESNPAFHRATLLYGLSLPVAPWTSR